MVDHGTHLTVQAGEMGKELPGVLNAVRAGRTVTITEQGKELAEIRPLVRKATDPLQVHPEFRAIKIEKDAFAPADDQDWPQEDR